MLDPLRASLAEVLYILMAGLLSGVVAAMAGLAVQSELVLIAVAAAGPALAARAVPREGWSLLALFLLGFGGALATAGWAVSGYST